MGFWLNQVSNASPCIQSTISLFVWLTMRRKARHMVHLCNYRNICRQKEPPGYLDTGVYFFYNKLQTEASVWSEQYGLAKRWFVSAKSQWFGEYKTRNCFNSLHGDLQQGWNRQIRPTSLQHFYWNSINPLWRKYKTQIYPHSKFSPPPQKNHPEN